MFGDDLTGPDGVAVEIETLVNGSFRELSGNFTLRYGAPGGNTTWPLLFNATAEDVEIALEVRSVHVIQDSKTA